MSIAIKEIHGYDAATAPRGIWKHVLPIFGYPKAITSNTTIIANFFRRDLLGRFRGSLLGIFWVLVQPIFTFLIYFFVFGFLFAPKLLPGAEPNIEFALYLFSGIIAFSAFSESTSRSCGVVLENSNLVKKVAFPCELLPIPNVMVSMITYAVGATVFLVIGFAAGELRLTTSMLAWPLVIVVHAVLALGVGLTLACLQVLLLDTSHLYSIFVQAWFFLSPIFWQPAMIESKLGKLSWIIELNPMYSLVMAHRLALGFHSDIGLMSHLHEDSTNWAIPPFGDEIAGVWHHLGLSSLWAVGFLLLGYSFFVSRKNKFSDLV